ncbi:MAG: T9SS type B sorting domain-containing protein [Cyclobacteriaceae bacterium]|nr:MAG: T9SS type B sorting domain-containing protein [Cyclobacteriaceae bacterium]
MNKFICLTLSAVSGFALAQSPDHLTQFPITEGSIHSITASGSYTVLQGNFNSIGSYQGNGVVIDVATGTYDPTWPIFHGNVSAAISDNNGGWFVAGTSNVNSTLYQRLVHVKSDKTIDETWSPTPNNFVSAFAIEGNTLYVGGAFTQIAGSARNLLAAFDITTGNLLPWNPNLTPGRVETLTASGGVVYVGGQFTEVGGQPRKNIAAINGATGVVTNWNPTVDGINSSVQTIKVAGGVVYAGGFFTSAGGQSRRSIAALDITTGTATAWNPNPSSGVVRTIELTGSTLFMGGTFTTVGGTLREYLAEVDLTTGALTSWDPNFDDATVYDLELAGTTLYVAGTFQTVNGTNREGLAAVSTSTGALLSWAYPGEGVTSIALADDLMFVEASDRNQFKFDWKATNDFAIVDNETGDLYLTNIDLGGETIISAIVRSDVVYLAGTFTEVNGEPRQGLAAIDILTGVVQPWAPVTDGNVVDMASFAGRIFLGGDFSSVNGSPTEALAIVDAVSGNLEPLSFDFEGGRITALDYSNGNIYAAGSFLIVNGINRENIVGIDAADGSILSWHPSDPSLETMNKLDADGDWVVVRNESNEVIVLETFDDDIYTSFLDMEDFALVENLLFLGSRNAGNFGTNGLAAYDLLTNDFTSWNPDVGVDPDGYESVSTVGANEDLIFISGNFTSLGFETREGLGVYGMYAVNQPPIIENTTSSVAIGGVITINLPDLISDPNNNLDLSSLQVLDGVSQAGAFATINASHELVLDYQGVAFNGTDVVTIEACDFDLACTQEQLSIEVIGSVIVYNALSPNGDTKNEIFYLQHIDILPDAQNNKVTIYNRWGDLVFETTNYNNDDRVFVGKNKNGNDLPSGTYFYKIEFSGQRPAISGFLSLKR